jgi:hypothetical protein
MARIVICNSPNILERILCSERCPEAKVKSALDPVTAEIKSALVTVKAELGTGFTPISFPNDERYEVLNYVSNTLLNTQDLNITHSLLTSSTGTSCLYVTIQASVVWYICQQLNQGRGISLEFLIDLIIKNRSFAAQSYFNGYLFWSRLDSLQKYVVLVHCADQTTHLTERHLWAFPLYPEATRRAVAISTAAQQLVTSYQLLVVYRDVNTRQIVCFCGSSETAQCIGKAMDGAKSIGGVINSMYSTSCRIFIDYIAPVYLAVQEALDSTSKKIRIQSHKKKYNRTIDISRCVCDIPLANITRGGYTSDSISIVVHSQEHPDSTSDLQRSGIMPPLTGQLKKVCLMFNTANTAKTRPIGYQKACVVCDRSYQLKLCQKCKSVYYCGRDHQRQHWKEHKRTCKST